VLLMFKNHLDSPHIWIDFDFGTAPPRPSHPCPTRIHTWTSHEQANWHRPYLD
jgi:hypothetical protein